MATVGEAIAASLLAQWNVGTGGTLPDPIQYLVERPERDPNPTVADAVYVWLPLKRTFDPIDVAEVYRNVTYTIRIVCHTKTSSARQLEIENEVDRILNSGTVITGATRQRVKEINDISNRSYSNLPKYISEVIMEVFTAMEVSATAYGTATTTTLTTDDLIVNTSITGNPTTALGNTAITGTLGVTGVTTFSDESITSTQIADLLMFGSANAAWVPCSIETATQVDAYYSRGSRMANAKNGAISWTWLLPLPTNKGGLKLYVSGTRINCSDADANNKVDTRTVYGLTDDSITSLDANTSDITSTGLHTDTFTAVDCSSYNQIMFVTAMNTANASALEVRCEVQCYYAA